MSQPKRWTRSGGQTAARGVVVLSIAQALVIVTGYAFHMVGSRVLLPAAYGSLVVAISLASWLKVVTASSFVPGICKMISEDPRRLSQALAEVGRYYRMLAVIVGALCVAGSWAIARAFGDSSLIPLLVVVGLGIPFFAMYALSRQALAALRSFVLAASVTTLYGLSRALLGSALILIGWGAVGGMAGLATGSLVGGGLGLWLLLGARHDGAAVHYPDMMPRCISWTLATLPSGAGMITLMTLDLWLVKAMIDDGVAVGVYAAAFTASRVPDFIVQGLNTATFARVSGALAAGDRVLAKSVSAESMRFLLVVFVPMWAIAAGSAGELMALVFGPAYAQGAVVLTLLVAAVALGAVVKQMLTMLSACDRPGLRLVWVALLLPVLLGLGVWWVPRYGPAGAAAASLATMALGALGSGITVNRHLGSYPPPLTVLRCCLAGAAVLALGKWWVSTGLLCLVEVAVLGTVYVGLLALTRELHAGDLGTMARVLRPRGEDA